MSFVVAALSEYAFDFVTNDEVLDIFIADGTGRCDGLVMSTNRFWIDFTPQRDDFPRWRERTPLELFSDSHVGALLEGIDHVAPVSLPRHRQVSGHGS
jgi:hypothetical protein